MLEAEAAGGADAQALHHAVGKHGEQRAGFGAEEKNEADPAPVGQRLLDAARLAGDQRMRHHVRVDAQRLDALRRPGAAHVLEGVVRLGMRIRDDVVDARREEDALRGDVAVHRLERRHALLDAEEPGDLFVAEDEHPARI